LGRSATAKKKELRKEICQLDASVFLIPGNEPPSIVKVMGGHCQVAYAT